MVWYGSTVGILCLLYPVTCVLLTWTANGSKKTNKDQKKQIRTIVVKIVKKLRKGRIKKKQMGIHMNKNERE